MSTSASFHRNVSLIMQFVPPSDDFKKHFREGMFDKPNTTGFIQVSHFLLTSYNAERFKETIDWPLPCKKSEAKYRKDVRELFLEIAAENTDITFPTILHSHLFHASGVTFMNIMWKLSQTVLRTCVERHAGEVLRKPKIGATGNPTVIKYQKGVVKSINNEIADRVKTLTNLEEIRKTAIQRERETLAAIKSELFEREKRIAKCAEIAPVQPVIKKRLMDITDKEVIDMFKAHIKQGVATIAECNRIIKKLEERTVKVHNVIMSSAEKKILDGKELEKIDLSSISRSSRETTGLASELYINGQLVLKPLLELFHTVLEPVELCLKRRNLGDFTECRRRLKETQEYLTTVRTACVTMLENINELSAETRQKYLKQATARDLDESVSSIVMNSEILMPSPSINIDTSSYNYEGHDIQNRLTLTPVEGAHKRLFSRYVPLTQSCQDSGVRVRPNLFLSRINLNETMSSLDGDHSRSRRLSPMKFFHPKPIADGRYSRLFSNQTSRSNRTLGNDSTMLSLPSTSKANSTAIANAIGEMGDISELNLDMTVKSLCNISADVPEKSSSKDHEKQEDHKIKGKTNLRLFQENIEVEITTAGVSTKQQTRQPRRSIGDLVERYKTLVDASKRTQIPKINVIPQEDD